MIIVKYIFAVLLSVPLAVIAIMIWSNFVDTSILNNKKDNKKREEREEVSGFTITIPDTGDEEDH